MVLIELAERICDLVEKNQELTEYHVLEFGLVSRHTIKIYLDDGKDLTLSLK